MSDKSITNLSLRDLLRRCEETEQLLRHREPILFPEYLLLRKAVENFERTPDKPYSEVKWPREAILLCLRLNKKWMTRKQIRRDLELGGFIFIPETFDNLLAAALRYHFKTGRLARRDENGQLIKTSTHTLQTRYRNEEYGLSEWVKMGIVESLK